MERSVYTFTGNTFDAAEYSKIGDAIINEVFGNNSSKVAVCIHETDNLGKGTIMSSRIYLYDTYINALPMINLHEYSVNEDVTVYEANKQGYAIMLHKAFDGVCYSRYANCRFNKFSIMDLRRMFDNKTDIILVEHLIKEENES